MYSKIDQLNCNLSSKLSFRVDFILEIAAFSPVQVKTKTDDGASTGVRSAGGGGGLNAAKG
ncbi:MAG: hypothetical protein WAK95_16775 [Desulfobacterales bacterium]